MARILALRYLWIQLCFFLFYTGINSNCSESKSYANSILEMREELQKNANEDNRLSFGVNRRNKRQIIDELQQKEFWHSYRFGTGTGNREVLRIAGVHEEKWMGEGCNGDGVWSWKSLETGRNQGLLLGLGKESLSLCSYSAPNLSTSGRKEYPAYNATQFSLTVSGFPTAAVMFQTWNDTSKTTDVIAVVAFEFHNAQPMLVWYRVLQNYGKSVLLPTTWPLQRSVWHILSFKIKNERIIVVLNDPRADRTDTTVDLHGFTWAEGGKTDFWLIQKLTVEEASSIAVVNVEETAFLGISQPEKGVIILYQFDLTQNKFVSFQEIEVIGSSNVVSFHVGFSAFMAVAGDKPVLLRYDKEEFIMEKIEGIEELGQVIYWLPVPIRTYRDEVVLLAETEIEDKRLVSIVTWTGGHPGFSLHSPTMCHVNGESVEGLWCLLNYDSDDDDSSRLGLQSAAALGVGRWTPGLIIPHSSGPSALFRLDSYIEPVLSPVLKEIYQLSKKKEEMEAIIDHQMKTIQKAKDALSDALNVQGSNVISGYWDISELQGKIVEIPDISQVSGEKILDDDHNDGLSGWRFGGLQWSIDDAKSIGRETLDSLAKHLEELESNLEGLKNGLNDAVPLERNAGEPVVVTGPKSFKGTVILDGKMAANDLSLDELNGIPVEEIFTDFVRLDNQRKIGGHKILESLHVEGLQVTDNLGDISVPSLVFSDDDVITINGNISYLNELQVLGDFIIPNGGLVNDIDISEVAIAVNRSYDLELSFESILAETVLAEEVNSLGINEEYLDSLFQENALGEQIVQSNLVIHSLEVLGKNVKIKELNGQDFNSILSSLVYTDNAEYIPGETYVKSCTAWSDVEAKSLNGLEFPNEYVRTSGDHLITGIKWFNNDDAVYSMHADVLLLTGLLDGVNTSHLITLTTDQLLQETSLNFDKLSVTNLKVIENVEGTPVTFYMNPSKLGESSEVFSNIYATNIEVDGDLRVKSTVGGTSWEEMLGGVIYDDEEDVSIHSAKFVVKNLVAGSITLEGFMNGLNVSEFLTTNTVQTLDEKQLFGNDLVVENVEIRNEMINKVNIKEFFDQSVKLSGGILSIEEPEADKIGQKIYGSVRFEEEVAVFPSLLTYAVNGHSAADVAFVNQNQEFTGDITFEFLHAMTMELGGPLQTEGLLTGINLTDFDRKRFSLSKPQEIEEYGAVHIHDGFIDGDLWVNSINGIVLETLDRSSLLAPEYDANKSYNIENMVVNGSIIADKIGVFDMKETMENAIWLNRENYIEGTITFEEEVVIENLQVEGNFNGDDLNSLLEDIVQQGEDVEITGHKTFVNGFRVGDVKATNLNGYPLDDILTTNTEQEILGPLIIKGNVVVEGNMKLSSESKVNAMDPATFAGRYEWRDGMHILKGDIKLRNCTSIDSLNVFGSVGNVDWERFIDDIVYIMDDVELQGNVTFNKKVVFERDVYVMDTVDGVNLEQLFGPIGSALLRDNQGRFQLSIEYGEADDPILLFKDDVVIKGGLFVSGDIIADEVYGCNLKEWTEEAIYLDQSDEIQGTKVFQSISSSSDVLVKFINKINLERVVLLNGDQNIDQELKFKSLYIPAGSDVHVENDVNGCKLEKEFKDTLLVEGDQIISGKKTFTNKVKVRGDVITTGTINGILTDNIATLDTDQEFRGLCKWNHMVAKGNVNVLGSVNGEDLSRWVDLAVCSDQGRSTITGRWNISGNVTLLGEDIPGYGTLGGVDVSQFQEITSPQSVTITGLVNRMTENLSGVCYDVEKLRDRVISQSFLFRELEALQIIKTNDDIQSMYHFSVLEEEYLTVSYVDKCGSDLYVWDHLSTNFILMRKLALGPILEWHTLGFVQDNVVIVAKTGGIGRECIKPGYNLWYFDPQEQQAKHFQVLGNFKSVKVLPREQIQNNLLYTLGHENIVTEWSLDNDGLLKKSKSWNVTGEYLTLVQEKDWEVRVVSNDKKVVELTGDISSELPDIYTIGDYEILSISEELVLGAYAVNEEAVVEGTGDYIKVFNLRDNSLFTVIPAIKPSSVIAVNFGYKRQKMFAFLEDLVILKMYEYKGALGFVECLSIPVRSFQLLALPLKTRNLFSPHNFILAQSSRAITVFEAKMYGDPVYGLKHFTCP